MAGLVASYSYSSSICYRHARVVVCSHHHDVATDKTDRTRHPLPRIRRVVVCCGVNARTRYRCWSALPSSCFRRWREKKCKRKRNVITARKLNRRKPPCRSEAVVAVAEYVNGTAGTNTCEGFVGPANTNPRTRILSYQHVSRQR